MKIISHGNIPWSYTVQGCAVVSAALQGPRYCLPSSAFYNRRLLPHDPMQLLELQLSHSHSNGQEVSKNGTYFPFKSTFQKLYLLFLFICLWLELSQLQSLEARRARKYCLNTIFARQYFEGNVSKQQTMYTRTGSSVYNIEESQKNHTYIPFIFLNYITIHSFLVGKGILLMGLQIQYHKTHYNGSSSIPSAGFLLSGLVCLFFFFWWRYLLLVFCGVFFKLVSELNNAVKNI